MTLSLASRWADCDRCGRCRGRLAVYAPSWPTAVQVVVLGTRAPWRAQGAGADDPRVARLVHVLRSRLGLTEVECVGDVLVACGAGNEVLPDEVAACTARLVENAVQATPKVIVFADRRTEALAAAAGQMSDACWSPSGAPWVPAVVALPDLEPVLRAVGDLLDRRPTALPGPVLSVSAYAGSLMPVLGAHGGARARLQTGKSKRHPRVNTELYEQHLLGDAVVSLVHTKGPWPFAVIVIRNSTCNADAEAVMKTALSFFSTSFILEDAASGDVHIYVALPVRSVTTSYGHGALVLRTFLEFMGMRWRRYTGEAEDGVTRAVLSEVAAAPAEPPMLPFGAGWARRGSTGTVESDIVAFINWMQQRDDADFLRAERMVRAALKFETDKWRERHRRRMREWLQEKELELDLKGVSDADLPAGWEPLTHQLSPSALAVARAGVRSHGTFSRRVVLLVDELAGVVDKLDVETLMMAWLSTKPMVDEGIAADPASARSRVLREIQRRYRPWHGVPARFWTVIERRVKAQWMKPAVLSAGSPNMTLHALLRTAFFLSRRFYRARSITCVIHFTAFERYTGSNTAKQVRVLLENANIMSMLKGSVNGVRSRTYSLPPDLWPASRGEPRVFRTTGL